MSDTWKLALCIVGISNLTTYFVTAQIMHHRGYEQARRIFSPF